MPAFSTIRITVRFGARVRWTIVSGTTNPCPGASSTVSSPSRIDQQLAVDHVKELVVVIVLVPVILAFDNAHAHHRVVHLAERLIEPFVVAGVGNRINVDDLQRPVQNVEAGFIGEGLQTRP